MLYVIYNSRKFFIIKVSYINLTLGEISVNPEGNLTLNDLLVS